MRKKLFLVFSHKLTQNQIKEAKIRFGIDEFVYMPKEIQSVWSNINPYVDSIQNQVLIVFEYIISVANLNDIILVQGDFGATFLLVKFLKENFYKCIYSTTNRESKEYVIEGKVIKNTIFNHIKFRRYE